MNYLHYDIVSTSATLAISYTSSTVMFLVRPLSQHNISGINDSLYLASPYSFLYQPNVNANGFPSVTTTINYFSSYPSKAIATSLKSFAEPTNTRVSTKPNIA